MRPFVYRFKYSGKTDTESISDLFFLACVAARALLGVDQAELEAVVSRGKRRVPVAIMADGKTGETLAKLFLAYANEILPHTEFETTRVPLDKEDA